MRLNLLFSFIILFGAIPIVAQTDTVNNGPQTLGTQARLSGSVFTFFMQARGSQYFKEEWMEGSVVLSSGEKVTGELLRYNAYLDELLWMPAFGSNPVMVDKGLVDHFFINTMHDTLLFRKTDYLPGIRDIGKGIFLQELYTGEYSLFAHRKVVQKRESVESIGNSTFARPYIQPETDYYMISNRGDVLAFSRLGNRRFSRLFEGRERDVRRILREEGIRISDERGLIQAIQLIDRAK